MTQEQHAGEGKEAMAVGALAWNDDVEFILGRPGFMFIREAQLFRSLGYAIPKKAEGEQAFFIHRWLNFYFKHGDDWRDVANADMLEHIQRGKSNTNTPAPTKGDGA